MAKKKQTVKSTARDVFFYLLMIITLYASVISFIALLWQYINVQFPDPLEFYYSGATSIMRTSISVLFVVWPVFLFMSWLINKDLKADKSKQDTWVRRWLLYLTLFIASVTIIVDLVSLIDNFLGGELTTRFALKVVVVLLVAVAVFWVYLWELRRDVAAKTNAHKILAICLSVLIVGWIVAGFFIVGTPAQQRAIRLDEQRVRDLQSIQSEVIYYWGQKEELPGALGDLSTETRGYIIPVDPETGVSYEYREVDDLTFELCADFATDSGETQAMQGRVSVYDRYGYLTPGAAEFWEHESGQNCFERTIDPELYDDNSPKPTVGF